MTLEEQVALLAGADSWTTVPIPRLGIPALKVTDGPAGARGGGPLIGGKRTAAFPVGIALGATWNVDLLREVGRHLAREARDKGAGVLLGPTVNLFRSTLNGRNFESYAEDPLLAGKLAAAYIAGLQEDGRRGDSEAFRGERVRVPARHDQQRHPRARPARALPAAVRAGGQGGRELGGHERIQPAGRRLL